MATFTRVSDALFRRNMLGPSFGHIVASVCGLVLLEQISMKWVLPPSFPMLRAMEASMGRLGMNMLLGFLGNFVGFWVIGTIFALPSFFEVKKWKIQVNKSLDLAALRKSMPLICFNFLLGSLIGPIVLCTMLPEQSFDLDQLPSISTLFRDAIVWLLVEEVMFFYVHRWLHVNKRAYYAIHKLHHTWTSPVSYVAIYCHPVEHLSSNIAPLLAGPLLCRSHTAAIGVYLFVGLIHTTAVHSGYWFCDDNGMHDEHHNKFNCNYGVMGIMDSWYGTYRLPAGAVPDSEREKCS
jgi:methylsterol monooxygenase